MRKIKIFVTCISAAAVMAGASLAQAEMTCRISMEIAKVGFIVGAAGGSGTLRCAGKSYPIEVGGLNAGFVVGASKMSLSGEARNVRDITDIEGTYAKSGASAAAGAGGANILATNEKGVQLAMRGSQVGLEASLDLGGMQVRLAN